MIKKLNRVEKLSLYNADKNNDLFSPFKKKKPSLKVFQFTSTSDMAKAPDMSGLNLKELTLTSHMCTDTKDLQSPEFIKKLPSSLEKLTMDGPIASLQGKEQFYIEKDLIKVVTLIAERCPALSTITLPENLSSIKTNIQEKFKNKIKIQ